jgi:tetratricopeptide (TPR) repeat protein
MPNIITGLAAPATVRSVIDGNWDNLLSGFHITAWLMTHYFVIESSDNESLGMQTREYLARYDAGDDPVVAFVESYGSIETIQRAINSYRNLKEFPVIQFPRFDYAGPIKTRELSPGEALYLLGDIAMEHNSIRRAHEYFDEFRALEIESPLAMKVESRRSIAFIHQGEIEKGDTIIEELVARDPNDPDVLADLAHYSYDRYLNSVNDSEPADSGHLDRAIEFGVHAIELEPQDSEALYYLGLAYERRGDLQLAADTLLMLYDINPRIPALKWNLARVAVKIDQIDFASRLISKLISAVPSTEARDLLREVQQRIESEELDNDSINDLFQEPVWASIRLDY